VIRVLVVEDSAAARELIAHILGSDAEIDVLGTASDGEQALAAVRQLKPDVITMDVHMPKMNGFEATRRIMEDRPTPIVIVSGAADVGGTATAFRAVEAGALAVLEKPAGAGHPDHRRTAEALVQTVRLMSEVKVVRRWPRSAPQDDLISPEPQPVSPPGAAVLIAVGASTGGPPVVQTVLSELPCGFPAAVLLVQHIAAGFTAGFAEWLDRSSSLSVRLPVDGERILPGHAYVAPEGFHMKVGGSGTICLSNEEPENGLRPSISVLFRSVAQTYGHKAVGVLLTGMGKDGALGLKSMKERGAVTIAQDKETSVIHGMPGEAIRVGAARYILPAGKIAAALRGLVSDTAQHCHEPT